MSYEELRRSISAMNFPPRGKFSSKLDFDQRCEILALYRTGVNRAVLGEAYGLDRRTVTHIYNSNSKHYKDVREEEEKLGRDGFLRKYITENALAKLKVIYDARQGPVIKPHAAKSNRVANKWAGIHSITNENLTQPHRILIGWVEALVDNDGAGWYYRDLDGPEPERWISNGPESMLTSRTCFDAVQINLIEL